MSKEEGKTNKGDYDDNEKNGVLKQALLNLARAEALTLDASGATIGELKTSLIALAAPLNGVKFYFNPKISALGPHDVYFKASPKKKVIDDFTSGKKGENKGEKFDASTASNKQKGNYGEIKSFDNLIKSQKLKDKGYNLKRIGDDAPKSVDDKIVKGIDGIYENSTPPPKFVIDEAKFGKSRLGKTRDGKQMSDDWIVGSDRLVNLVGSKKARQIEKALKNGEVDRVLSKVDKNGNVITKQLDENGKKISNWPPENK